MKLNQLFKKYLTVTLFIMTMVLSLESFAQERGDPGPVSYTNLESGYIQEYKLSPDVFEFKVFGKMVCDRFNFGANKLGCEKAASDFYQAKAQSICKNKSLTKVLGIKVNYSIAAVKDKDTSFNPQDLVVSTGVGITCSPEVKVVTPPPRDPQDVGR